MWMETIKKSWRAQKSVRDKIPPGKVAWADIGSLGARHCRSIVRSRRFRATNDPGHVLPLKSSIFLLKK